MKKTITLLSFAFCLNMNAQIITTVAGNGTGGYSGDGGAATAAQLHSPFGVAFDGSGNLYIVDWKNNNIRKVNTAGIITTIAGDTTGISTNSNYGYSGDGGAATSALLHSPYGIALDATGNVYFADGANHRIRKVNTSGIITTVAGNGTISFSGDGGQATAAELDYPEGITFDATGNLYIADWGNHRIRKVNTSGIITTVAGNGTTGYSGDGGAATNAELDQPEGVVLDGAGNLYLSDGTRIRKVNTSGIITTVAGNGTTGYSGDGGAATNAELNYSNGVALDGAGNLYIADGNNNRIRKVNTLGIITTVAGNGTGGYAGNGGAATAAELFQSMAVVFDAVGNLYIADYNSIRMVNHVGTTGINQVGMMDKEVRIYPNPSSGSFIIHTNTTNKQTVLVYDVSGKIVLSQSINGTTTINASALAVGVYIVNITGSEGVVNKRLVIVK